jgi:hypothetical protein
MSSTSILHPSPATAHIPQILLLASDFLLLSMSLIFSFAKEGSPEFGLALLDFLKQIKLAHLFN